MELIGQEGGEREWMWGQGEEVASNRTLKSIDGFLTVSVLLYCVLRNGRGKSEWTGDGADGVIYHRLTIA